MKLLILMATAMSLFGCAAALVPESFDADVKVNQAYVLMDEQGRPLAALMLLQQAEEMAQDKKNLETLARIETAYGDLYKTDQPSNEGQITDPTKAIFHYARAVTYRHQLKQYKAEAVVDYMGLWPSYVFLKVDNLKKQCEVLQAAKTAYLLPGSVDAKSVLRANDSLLAVIKDKLKELKCAKVH